MKLPGTVQQDVAGLKTLELFSEADQFNKWLYSRLKPYIQDGILEIGSGIGNISTFLLNDFANVTLSDLHPDYCIHLSQKFGKSPNLNKVLVADLADNELLQEEYLSNESFHSIIASNVVEHIENDRLAMKNAYDLLAPGGRFIVLVPAYNYLYNSFDIELGHFRRYSQSKLEESLKSAGFNILNTSYFNALGILGWWVSGTLMKKKLIPGNLLKKYNNLIPIIRLFDNLLLQKVGLSVISIAEKPKI